MNTRIREMKFDWIDVIVCFALGALLVSVLLLGFAPKKKPGTHTIVTHFTNDTGAVVSTNVEHRDLPEGIVIQKSSDGRFRWVAFSNKFPDGYPDMWTHDSYEDAVAAYWKARKWDEERRQQTWEPVNEPR